MRKTIFLISFVLLFNGCSVLWDYKPHVIGDEGERLPNKHLFYVEGGVNILILYNLIDKFPKDTDIIRESRKYIKTAAENIVNRDWDAIVSRYPINRNDRSVLDLKKKCVNFLCGMSDSLLSVKRIWVRKYKKRRFLWFYKNVYDVQYLVHFPLYKRRREMTKFLGEYTKTDYVPLRTFAVYYIDLIEGKIKIEKGKEE